MRRRTSRKMRVARLYVAKRRAKPTVSASGSSRAPEARTAVGELLKLIPDFSDSGPRLIGRYVKADGLVEKVMAGLQKAGLADFE